MEASRIVVQRQMVYVRTVVVSVLFAHRTGHVEVLSVVARSGADFDGRSRHLDIGKLGGLVVEVDFGSDDGSVDVAIDAGVVAVEHHVLDERTNEHRDQVVDLVVVAGRYALVEAGHAEGLTGGVEADFEDRVGLGEGWPVLTAVAVQVARDGQ